MSTTNPLIVRLRSDHVVREIQHGNAIDTDDGHGPFAYVKWITPKTCEVQFRDPNRAIYRLTSALDIIADNGGVGGAYNDDERRELRAIWTAFQRLVGQVVDHFGPDALTDHNRGWARQWYPGRWPS